MLKNCTFITHTSMFMQTYNFMNMEPSLFFITLRDFHDLHVFGRPLLILEEKKMQKCMCCIY